MLPREVIHPLLRYCEQADTPRTLSAFLMIRYEAWDELVSHTISPSDYCDAASYFLDNQAFAWLKKYEALPTSFDRKAEAIKSLYSAEHQCKLANDRLSRFLNNGPFESISELRIFEIIKDIRKTIKKILRDCPEPEFRFGPGVTLSDCGTDVTVLHKCSSMPSITPDALWLLPFFARTAWGRNPAVKEIQVVDQARYTTVPKNCKTDRGIEIQASINVAAQLGYGSAIRDRLKRCGLDLRNAQDLHRSLARRGSIDDSLATIDLKSASDTICRNVVKLLLPDDWFSALDSIRSKRICVDGHTIHLERFSSMGNGYTFELESLIFYAICKTVTGAFCSVYGDDIIVETSHTQAVVSALRFFGFTPNLEKSFWSGAFRESCGGDFFDGLDVRPFQLKKDPNNAAKLLSYCNGVRRASHRFFDGCFDFSPFHRSWLLLTDYLPKYVRDCRGPATLGDIVLHDEPSRWRVRFEHGVAYFRAYRPKISAGVRWSRFCEDTQLAAALYGAATTQVESHGVATGLSYRDSVLRYVVDEIDHV